MFAPPKRKSKSSKDKEKSSKHERSGSAKRIEVSEKVVFKTETETDKKKLTRNASATSATEVVVSDDNFNSKVNNPLSRDISIEGQVPLDTQIERGIMNLLEQEIARVDKKQYPPRPQSLSFYEDEFGGDDTDLSGQLQALSPAEKQSIVQNRTKNNFMTINANVDNNSPDVHNKNDQHGGGGGTSSKRNSDDYNLSNSREKIVSDQKKLKKHQRKNKKDDTNNGAGSSSVKKSKKRNQSFFNEAYQPKTDITMALEDLQDDVFEGPAPIHGYNYGDSPKSPQYGGISPPLDIPTKIYIGHNQLSSSNDNTNRAKPVNPPLGLGDQQFSESTTDLIPLDIAIFLQRIWMPFSTFCHGLLAGVALMNLMMLYVFKPIDHEDFIMACIELSEYYKTLFFILCIICIVSVFDRYDLAHFNVKHVTDLWIYRKSCIVIVIYLATLICFLSETNRNGYYQLISEKTVRVIKHDGVLLHSMWTSIGAILGWFILSCSKYDDLLRIHLDNISTKYTNNESNKNVK